MEKTEKEKVGSIGLERKVNKVYEIHPSRRQLSKLEKATSKVMESAFFKAVDNLVEQDDDCPDSEEEDEDNKAYYDSVFDDYSNTFKDVGKPESMMYHKNEIDNFFSVNRKPGAMPGGVPGSPIVNINKAEEVKVSVPGFGDLETGDTVSDKIPGFIDDRLAHGLAETGIESVASTFGRMMVEEHQNAAINDME